MAQTHSDGGLPDVRLLRTFMAVAQDLSFTRASERLFLTQQTVSSQVRALEVSLGVQLFRRTTRSVRLTVPGASLMRQLLPVLEALDEAVTNARAAAQGSGPIVLIGHTESAAYGLLPRAAGLMTENFPEVQVRTEPLTEQALRAAVTEGRVHLGVGLEISVKGARVSRQALGGEPWCAVVRSGHPLAARERVGVTDLAPYSLLSWPRTTHPGHWRAVHGIAATGTAPAKVKEMWLSLARHTLITTDAVMPQPLSFATALTPGLLALKLEGGPVGRFSAEWSTLAPPPYLHPLLDSLVRAAAHQTMATPPPRMSA